MKEIFHIQVPGVDVAAVIREIDAEAATRFSQEEAARIAQLSFTPAPGRGGAFDPVDTGELFERPVDSPDFQSAKYRYVRGPLRWLARFLFKWASALFDKLSENKVQAFYHVVHETIALNHRLSRLSEEMHSLMEENLRLRDMLRADDSTVSVSTTGGTFPADLVPRGLQAPSVDPSWDRAFFEAVGRSALITVLDDFRARTTLHLKSAGYAQVRLSTADIIEAELIRRNFHPDVVCASSDEAVLMQNAAPVDAFVFPEIGRMSGPPLETLRAAAARLPVRGKIVLRHQAPDPGSPFAARHSHNVNEAALLDFLGTIGLTLVSHESIPAAALSFQIIAEKP